MCLRKLRGGYIILKKIPVAPSFSNDELMDCYTVEPTTSETKEILKLGCQFKDIVIIGKYKWAIHTSTSSLNQGYGQTHDSLLLLLNKKLSLPQIGHPG